MDRRIKGIIKQIIKAEGGYVDHEHDRGGPTKYGITLKTLSRYKNRVVSRSDVKKISKALATEIYYKDYFLSPRIDQLPEDIQHFVFDSSVNHGPRRAIKFLQMLCNQILEQPPLDVDGALGPKTLEAIKLAMNEMGGLFYKALIEERRVFYHSIVKADASQNAFLKGWLARLEEFEKGDGDGDA